MNDYSNDAKLVYAPQFYVEYKRVNKSIFQSYQSLHQKNKHIFIVDNDNLFMFNATFFVNQVSSSEKFHQQHEKKLITLLGITEEYRLSSIENGVRLYMSFTSSPIKHITNAKKLVKMIGTYLVTKYLHITISQHDI